MKLSKKVVSILLTLCFITSGMIFVNAEDEAQTPPAWDGTADTSWYNITDTVFHIDTAEELAGLAKLVNDKTEDFEGKTVTLDADIVLYSGNAKDWETTAPSKIYSFGWNPIGYEDAKHVDTNGEHIYTGASFKGTFDGNGHAVRGLYYARGSATNSVGIGLFGFVEGATIKRLRVENSFIKACSAVGGIVGWARDGGVTISDCYSDAIISIYGRYAGHGGYGGILGRADVGTVTISGCWFDGDIRDNSSLKDEYGIGVGGIVGFLGTVGNTINNCLVTGDIAGNTQVGGIVGRCNNVFGSDVVEIISTLMLGTVTAQRDNKTVFGGEFIGIMYSGDGYPTASLNNIYGKEDFMITLHPNYSNGNDRTEPEYVWSTNTSKPQNVNVSVDRSYIAHRLSNEALKSLVGYQLAIDEWSTSAEYWHPVPAYFAPVLNVDPAPSTSADIEFVGVQSTFANNGEFSIRLVATVGANFEKLSEYNSLGFDIFAKHTKEGETLEMSKNNFEYRTHFVYKSINGNDNGNRVSYNASSFENANYLYALAIQDLSVDGKYVFTITPFVYTKEQQKELADYTYTVIYNNGQFVDAYVRAAHN